MNIMKYGEGQARRSQIGNHWRPLATADPKLRYEGEIIRQISFAQAQEKKNLFKLSHAKDVKGELVPFSRSASNRELLL